MHSHDMPGIRSLIYPAFLCLLAGSVPATAQIVIPNVPLNDSQSSPPIVMLVASKDHKLFFEAYNDAIDLDGDGKIDVGFKPHIVYYGLFDSKLCYEGRGRNSGGSLSNSSYSKTADFFDPVAPVTNMERHTCSGGRWSGNFLNYVTTSRIDALRKVLYGGLRSDDPTSSNTILRRAYIPKDGHAWGKEYTSVAVDGYNIADYTPFSIPDAGKRHFFGNYTWFASCSTAVNCRDNAAPTLAVALNAAVGKRIWDWADAEINQLFDDRLVGAATSRKYVAQVKVCSAAFKLPDGTEDYRGDNCKPYTDSRGNTIYKPIGVLHKFGEDGSVLFGLLTGSFDMNTSGGKLRKRVGSFADEINPDGTGRFKTTAATAPIVSTFNSLMVRGFGANGGLEYRNFLAAGNGVRLGHRLMKDIEFPDWGNPIGEMMYEALRYLGGEGTATPEFNTATTIDTNIFGAAPTWDRPYNTVPWCSKPNLLVLSDTNPSYDSDQLPGARFHSCTSVTNVSTPLNTAAACTKMGSSFSRTLGTFNAGQLLDEIGLKEGIHNKDYFIGQSGDLTDWAPTTKRATSLSTIRGLPEEPGKEGSYTSAAVAYYGRTVGIPTVTGKPKQYVDTYVVALDSPLPKMEVTTSKGTITLVPFGKSVAGSGFNLDARKDYYQPANQIIKFYVDHLILSDPSKGIRYNAKFLISYEDSEEGGDYDMDFIVEYLIEETPEGDVNVTLTPRYFGAAITMNVGYTVSGAGTKDGPYLVVQDRSRDNQNRINPTYHLNVPDGRSVGYCDASKPGSNPSDPGCATLPACSTGTFGACTLNQKSVQRFTPSGGSAATLLKDPLWYAAKWGGFRGNPGDAQFWPNTPEKWDSTGGGQPDNYFPVRNALQLEKALVNAINAIRESGGKSSGRINTSSDILASGDTLVFNTTLTATSDPPDWSGDLVATAIIRVDKDNISGLGPVRWQAAEKLPAASARSIFTRNNANLLDIPSNGVEFKWEQLNSGQQTALTWDRKFDGSSVLDYVRGSAEKEISHSGIFRNRTRMGGALSPLGDSPNNTPRYFKATDTVYLGANDGMLHAFNGATGQELFAYIPSALIPKLPELAQSDYGHAWYVDGEVTIGTIQESSVSVKHMLIAALGRGGKGLFGLDVTTPASFSASNVAWELNGPPVDQCKTTDDDANNIGLILGAPLIGTFNDGKTYAIVGNGYNSCRGRAVLYVIDIQTGNVVRRIDTSTATNNGLSTPVALDLDGDGKIDLVYAGDLLGNLWRFDMRSDKPADWRARLGRTSTTATAFFSAGSTKPITAPPAAILDSDGIPWVFFGTGRYLSIADKSNQDIQSWYGLMDNTDTNTTTITSAQLTQRKFESFGTTTLSNGRETTIRNVQKQAGTTDMVGKRGWYINFDVKSDAGERVISAPLIIKARHETVIEIPTIIPSSDPCLAGGRGYINFINAFTGAALEYAFIDLNGDGVVNSLDITGGSFPGSIDLQDAMPGNLAIVGEQNIVGGTGGGLSVLKKDLGLSTGGQQGRISWREIIRPD